MATGSLQNDPLFVGLTRPTLFLGVSFMFSILNGLICLVYFINSSNLMAFIYMPALHMIGYIICFKEPLFMELYIIKMQKCNICKNKLFHGSNSYDPY